MGLVQNGVLFLQFLMICYFIILAIYHSHSSTTTQVTLPGSSEKTNILVNRNNVGVQSLLELIHNQNDTIHKLGQLLESTHQSKEELLYNQHHSLNKESALDDAHVLGKEAEMKEMEAQIEKLTKMTTSLNHELELSRSKQPPSPSTYSNALNEKACPPCPTCRPVSSHSSTTTSATSHSAVSKASWATAALSSVESQCETQYGLSLIQEWRKSEQTWCKAFLYPIFSLLSSL